MGFIEDMEDLPNKVAKPFITFGNMVANTGEDVIDKLEDYAETGFNSVKNVALQVGEKMEDIGETMWGGVLTAKDEIVDAAEYIKDEGIPALKKIGKNIAVFTLTFYWIVLGILFIKIMGPVRKLAYKGIEMSKKQRKVDLSSVTDPKVVAIIGIIVLAIIIYAFYRMNKALQNIKKTFQ
jgi:hypothetical protein